LTKRDRSWSRWRLATSSSPQTNTDQASR
jgi:hypothetical protein